VAVLLPGRRKVGNEPFAEPAARADRPAMTIAGFARLGETALAETAKLYPDRFVAIASHLIPKDVSVSLSARLPASLDATDWELLIETLDAIKQCLPDAGQRQPGEVMRYVLEAIRMANAPTIEG
jgi:hypothetical protein